MVRYELAFRKLIQALKAGFNENQPRDERGCWTTEGGVEVTTYDGFLTGIPTIDIHVGSAEQYFDQGDGRA